MEGYTPPIALLILAVVVTGYYYYTSKKCYCKGTISSTNACKNCKYGKIVVIVIIGVLISYFIRYYYTNNYYSSGYTLQKEIKAEFKPFKKSDVKLLEEYTQECKIKNNLLSEDVYNITGNEKLKNFMD